MTTSSTKKMSHLDFRAWRAKQKLTQEQAASYLHLSVSTIRAYEASPRRNHKARAVPAYMAAYLQALKDQEELRTMKRDLRKERRLGA